ncbi:hypothetical protein ACTXT7_009829 [Hymenolepis weldensis]
MADLRTMPSQSHIFGQRRLIQLLDFNARMWQNRIGQKRMTDMKSVLPFRRTAKHRVACPRLGFSNFAAIH